MICLMALPSSAETSSSEEVVDRIVAIVNNDIILLSDVNRALIPYAKNIKDRHLPEKTENMMLSRAHDEILESLINEKLVLQKAAELRIAVGDDEVNAALEQMKESMPNSDEAFRSFLSEMGYTLDEYREQIRNQIIKSRLLNQEIKSKIVVTSEEIQDYYQNHPNEFSSGTQYHLRHIIMQIPKGADQEGKEAVRLKMEEIHQRIKDGASFEDMAKQYSQSSFAKIGGDLGMFAESDLAPEIKDVIVGTKEGEITPVIETDLGYQIFYVQSIIRNDGTLGDAVSQRGSTPGLNNCARRLILK